MATADGAAAGARRSVRGVRPLDDGGAAFVVEVVADPSAQTPRQRRHRLRGAAFFAAAI